MQGPDVMHADRLGERLGEDQALQFAQRAGGVRSAADGFQMVLHQLAAFALPPLIECGRAGGDGKLDVAVPDAAGVRQDLRRAVRTSIGEQGASPGTVRDDEVDVALARLDHQPVRVPPRAFDGSIDGCDPKCGPQPGKVGAKGLHRRRRRVVPEQTLQFVDVDAAPPAQREDGEELAGLPFEPDGGTLSVDDRRRPENAHLRQTTSAPARTYAPSRTTSRTTSGPRQRSETIRNMTTTHDPNPPALVAGLNHVAILTPDLDRVTAFYTHTFGATAGADAGPARCRGRGDRPARTNRRDRVRAGRGTPSRCRVDRGDGPRAPRSRRARSRISGGTRRGSPTPRRMCRQRRCRPRLRLDAVRLLHQPGRDGERDLLDSRSVPARSACADHALTRAISPMWPPPNNRPGANSVDPMSLRWRDETHVRHLRSHRGHTRHSDATTAERSTRSDQDGRRSGLCRFPSRRTPWLGPVHGTEPRGVHRGRLPDHQEHPPGADGEVVAAASPRSDHRRHGHRRQPDQWSSRLRCRPRRRTHRALLVRQQLAGVEGSVRRHPRHHLRGVRDWRDQQRELEVLRLPDHPYVDETRTEPDSVLVPRQPGHRRSPWHEPDVAGPDRQGVARRVRRDLECPQGRHPPRRRSQLRTARRLHHVAWPLRRPRARRSRSSVAAWTV